LPDLPFEHLANAAHDFWRAIYLPLPFFVLLALVVKRERFVGDILKAVPQAKINLLIHFIDVLLVAPILVALALFMKQAFETYDLALVPATMWEELHPALVGLAAVFLGDFIGYWRHRIEHSALLWPSHAVHHSDTEMTWLAIFRFHPINRLTTVAIDFAFILSMGLPAYAILVNWLVRHYYGAFIHADLPWTYGPFGRIFVSPAMHRWHHSAEPIAYNTNFASVFSVFDWAFGTFRVPGACDTALGVPQPMGNGLIGQLTYPLRRSSYRHFVRRLTHWRSRSA